MKLVSIYKVDDAAGILYMLLAERTPEQSISHKRLPTIEEHCDFVLKKPYRVWYLIEDNGEYVGSIYLTKQSEVGVFVFKKYQGKGYGKFAVKDMIRRWPQRMIANINPKNEASKEFFKKMGFAGPIQESYEFNPHK